MSESRTGPARAELGAGPEFDLIRRFLRAAPPAGPAVLVGPGDDCAVVAGGPVALSSDMSVEDVHFRRAWLSPREIGYRAATAALSDLAAMAATPVGLLVSLALAPADAEATAVALMQGVGEAAGAVGGTVLGGDVTRSPGPLVLDVTVVGTVETPVLRGGARPGDELWVTGRLGGAAAAVAAWTAGGEPSAGARAAFARPAARVREARWLAEHARVSAMIDLSDGLAGDAAHLAAAGGVALVLRPAAVPVHPAAADAAHGEALRLALSGGEDYELLFTAPPGAVAAIRAEFSARFSLELTPVGEVAAAGAAGGGLFEETAGGRVPFTSRGFQHFRP